MKHVESLQPTFRKSSSITQSCPFQIQALADTVQSRLCQTLVLSFNVNRRLLFQPKKSGAVISSPATSSVSDGPTNSAAHQQPALQSLLQQSLEPVSDSSADAVLDIQNKVLTDMASHFNLKFTNKPLWMTLQHKGTFEFFFRTST
jgi:hypothetical protein